MAFHDWPRMMKVATAARYCDLPQKEFLQEVAAGRLPQPVRLGNQDHWSRARLDETFEAMDGKVKKANWREGTPLYARA